MLDHLLFIVQTKLPKRFLKLGTRILLVPLGRNGKLFFRGAAESGNSFLLPADDSLLEIIDHLFLLGEGKLCLQIDQLLG